VIDDRDLTDLPVSICIKTEEGCMRFTTDDKESQRYFGNIDLWLGPKEAETFAKSILKLIPELQST
jgi:hypothetical protein